MNEARYFNHTEKRELLERQEYICGECGKDLWHEHIGANPAHHILPAWAGGITEVENGVILCHECHLLWDNRSVIGEFYPGGYNLSDFEQEQIKNEDMYFGALEKIYKNKQKNLNIK